MVLEKIISGGVGIAAEAIQHHKNKKKAAKSTSPDQSTPTSPPPYSPPSSSRQSFQAYDYNDEKKGSSSNYTSEKEERGSSSRSDDLEIDNLDEALWELDDAACQNREERKATRAIIPKGIGKDPARISILVDAFVSTHKPQVRQYPAHLPEAVIIPQRRPEARDRGFVRAYAPCLESCGISQDTFMDFHDFYDESLRFSNVIKVVTLAAGIAGLVPSPTAMIVSTTVTLAAKVAASLQSRQRANDFLSQMNIQYFMPMGLICLVMKYTPPSDYENYETLDQAYNQASSSSRWNFHSSHGHMGDTYMPPAAPLVFPELPSTSTQGESNKFKRSMRFIQDYQDRRAQANFSGRSPDSQLSMAVESQLKFESSLGDPRKFSSSSLNGSRGSLMMDRGGSRRAGPLGLVFAAASQYAESQRGQKQTNNTMEPPLYDPSSSSFHPRGGFGGRGQLLQAPHGRVSHRSADFHNCREDALYDRSHASQTRHDRFSRRGDGFQDRSIRGDRGRDGGPLGLLKKKDVLYMMIVPLPTQEQINAVQEAPPQYMEMEEIRL